PLPADTTSMPIPRFPPGLPLDFSEGQESTAYNPKFGDESEEKPAEDADKSTSPPANPRENATPSTEESIETVDVN
uniref:Acp7 n=1 Tax=Panagrellus redivivus TaxID=6233 RepID=A0A7E4VUC8_PANRE